MLAFPVRAVELRSATLLQNRFFLISRLNQTSLTQYSVYVGDRETFLHVLELHLIVVPRRLTEKNLLSFGNLWGSLLFLENRGNYVRHFLGNDASTIRKRGCIVEGGTDNCSIPIIYWNWNVNRPWQKHVELPSWHLQSKFHLLNSFTVSYSLFC